MTQADKPPPTQSSSRHRTRQSLIYQVMARLWPEWRLEVFIVLLVAVGIFLLVEQMQIRQTLLSWLRWGFQALRSFGGSMRRGLVDFVRNTTFSDLTGYALLLIALAFAAWRTRWRLMTMPRFTARKCPRCGSDLRRIHRRFLDRLLSLFVPVRRYRCRNRDCWWCGLRVRED